MPSYPVHAEAGAAPVVFILDDLPDAQVLAQAAPDGAEVVWLDASGDALAQMAAWLEGRSGIDALHLFSHGSVGAVRLGDRWLDAHAVKERASLLEAIGRSLTADADIFLYGCETGSDVAGSAFLQALAEVTGADVAASSDRTGAADLGGNWQLEAQVGAVDTAAALAVEGFSFALDASLPITETYDGLTYAEPSTSFELNGIRYTVNVETRNGVLSGVGVPLSSGGDDGVLNFNLASFGYEEPWNVNMRSVTISLVSGEPFRLMGLDLDSMSGNVAGTAPLLLTVDGSPTPARTYPYAGGVMTHQGVSFAADASFWNITSFTFSSTDVFDLMLDNLQLDVVKQVPQLTAVNYDARDGVLSVTGTGLTLGDPIRLASLTLTGQGNQTYTLSTSDLANPGTPVMATSTGFVITLSATARAAVNALFGGAGTEAPDGTVFNLAADGAWNQNASNASDAVTPVTVANFPPPSLTSATYNVATGELVVTGTYFVAADGAANDIVASLFTFTGEGGLTHTLSDTANVDITSSSSFTLMLGDADRAALRQLMNSDGATSTGGATYNLAAAEGWSPGASPNAHADLSANPVTVSNVPVPVISGATYDVDTGTLVVSGTDFPALHGADNDIIASRFTLTGEGGATWTLTDTPNVEISSSTSFTLVLSAADRAGLASILNRDGTASTGGASYNLAAAEDWAAGAAAAVVVADLSGNPVTVSNVPAPTITSATYDAATGTLVVTGTSFLGLAGATNDIIAGKFTLTGEGGATWTLTDTPNVEISSSTSFTLVLSAADRAGLASILNRDGTASTGSASYNLAAAEDWAAGAAAAVVVADLSGNPVTVSNVPVPTITSATYDAATGTLVVTGTNFLGLPDADNDIDVTKLQLHSGMTTTTLSVTSNVDITSSTSFTVVLDESERDNVQQWFNKNGGESSDGGAYGLSVLEDWALGAGQEVDVADPTVRSLTVSGVVAPAVVETQWPAGTYGIGRMIIVDVRFDQPVFVDGSGAPTLALTLDTGGTVQAEYLEDDGNGTLRFGYTIQEGDVDADGVVPATTLDLNGGTLRNIHGTDAALDGFTFDLSEPVIVDGVRPEVSSIVRVSDALTNASEIEFDVTFSEDVTGVDAEDFTVMRDGSATGAVTQVTEIDAKTYRVTVSDVGGNGSLRLNVNDTGTGIMDAASNQVGGYSAGESYTIDTVAPTIHSGGVSGGKTYGPGDTLYFFVWYTEGVTVTGTPRLAVQVGDQTVYADYHGFSAGGLEFRYTVVAGDFDNDGVVVSELQLNGGSIRDAAGNDASLDFSDLLQTQGMLVDGIAPAVTAVSSSSADGAYLEGDVITLTVTFDEPVTVTGVPTLRLETGDTDRVATYADGTGTNVLSFTYTVQAGDLSADLDVTGTDALDLNGGTIRDAGGNAAVLTLPAPGTPGSLGANMDLVIGNRAPEVPAQAPVVYTDTPAWDSFAVRTGTLAATDPDGDTLSYTLVGASTSGTTQTLDNAYGTLTLDSASGQWRFTPNEAALNAAAGVTTASFALSVSDGIASTPGELRIRIDGVNDTPRVLGGTTATLAEDGMAATALGQLQLADAEGNPPVITAQQADTALGGRFVIDALGRWSYTLDNTRIQHLGAGQGVVERFEVAVAGLGAVPVEVTLTGVNDAPSFAAEQRSFNVQEGNTRVSQLWATDVDGDALSYRITGGADAALFLVDADTGVLRFKTAPSFNQPGDAGRDNRYDLTVSVTDPHGASAEQRLLVQVTSNPRTDADGDGIAQEVEAQVPGGSRGTRGDGNGDGVPDTQQAHVASLPGAPTNSGGARPYLTLTTNDTTHTLQQVSIAMPDDNLPPLPRGLQTALGVLSFQVQGLATGGSTQMSIYVDEGVNVNGYFKLDERGQWVNIAERVVLDRATGKTRVDFTLTDGRRFDDDGLANGVIVDPGIVGLSDTDGLIPTREVYRFYNVDIAKHFFTADADEADALAAEGTGWTDEGAPFHSPTDGSGEAVWRFFNPDTGNHFYTMEAQEKDFLIANVPEYVFEGESWRAYRDASEDTTALHRFYNPDTANHFYTTSEDEKLMLIGLGDYAYEGVVAWVLP